MEQKKQENTWIWVWQWQSTKRAKGDKRKGELLTNGKERYRNGRVAEEENTHQWDQKCKIQSRSSKAVKHRGQRSSTVATWIG